MAIQIKPWLKIDDFNVARTVVVASDEICVSSAETRVVVRCAPDDRPSFTFFTSIKNTVARNLKWPETRYKTLQQSWMTKTRLCQDVACRMGARLWRYEMAKDGVGCRGMFC